MIRIYLFFLILAASASAGVEFQGRATNTRPVGGAEHHGLTFQLEETRLRVDRRAAEGEALLNSLLFDQTAETVWHIDHQKQVILRITSENVRELAKRMALVRAQMKARLEQLPEEKRALAEELMKSRLPDPAAQSPSGEIARTDATERIGRTETRRHDVIEEKRVIRSLWVADYQTLKMKADDFAVFGRLSAFYRKMFAAIGDQAGGLAQNNAFADLERVDGFPLRVRNFLAGGAVKSETEFSDFTRRELPEGWFALTENYTVKDAFEADQ